MFTEYFYIITSVAAWIAASVYLFSGVEDLLFDLFFLRYRRGKVKDSISLEKLKGHTEKRIAVFVPAWQESGIISRMAAYACQTLQYGAYDIFIGTYPNDPKTGQEVESVLAQHPHIHHVINSRKGPTSKADCLNAIYAGMREVEKARGIRFEIIAIHDSEDVLHPQTLRVYNFHIPDQLDMVQIPVFPLANDFMTGWVRNTYLDEFCESHLKDMLIRQTMGGIVPSAGVGTAFDRNSLDQLAEKNEGRPFMTESLTEDYVVGLQMCQIGKRAGFVSSPLQTTAGEGDAGRRAADIVSVREYFPATLTASVRQRSRWILGIAFQSWRICGWFGTLAQRYTLYRDRRNPLLHIATPISYIVILYILIQWICVQLGFADKETFPPLFLEQPMLWNCTVVATLLLIYRLIVKASCVHRIFGIKEALLCWLRLPVANVINFLATFRAVRLYLTHRIVGSPLAWNKTTHQFPTDQTLQTQVNAGSGD